MVDQERRRYERTPLITYSRVYLQESGKFIGYVCDMSTSGLMTLSDAPIPDDMRCVLKVEVPPLGMATPDWMSIPARSAWCQSDLDPNKYNVGWQFLEVSPENQAIIAAILDQYDLYENQF